MIEPKQGCIEQEQDSIGQYEMVVGRVYDISFKDCCIAGNFTSRLIDVFNPGIENTDILKWTFANGVVLRRMECCIIREVDIPEDREFISRAKLEATFKRLASYYEDRARVSAKQMKEAVDCQSACDTGVVAARWEARRDGVLQVATNLDIELQEEKPARNKLFALLAEDTQQEVNHVESIRANYKAEIKKVFLAHIRDYEDCMAREDDCYRLLQEVDTGDVAPAVSLNHAKRNAIREIARNLGIELEGE